ncbi:MAG TPA: ORF6N domain-containing protein [Saprospiraceae bacterium]|nr:ORF6N domain-containing protein [Saprospiraceae bacterium]
MSAKKPGTGILGVQNAILNIRGLKVMLDRDLADLYGVETKRLNEQVKRNKARFPPDFMFKLTKKEKEWVVANCDHLLVLKFSRTTPYAFTEHGAVMLAAILNTTVAVKTSILVVRAFVELRKSTTSNQDLGRKINELEMKYDERFSIVFKALKKLIDKPIPPRRQIGFNKRE